MNTYESAVSDGGDADVRQSHERHRSAEDDGRLRNGGDGVAFGEFVVVVGHVERVELREGADPRHGGDQVVGDGQLL